MSGDATCGQRAFIKMQVSQGRRCIWTGLDVLWEIGRGLCDSFFPLSKIENFSLTDENVR